MEYKLSYVMRVGTTVFLSRNGYPSIEEKRQAYETVYGVPENEEERATDNTVEEYVIISKCQNVPCYHYVVYGDTLEVICDYGTPISINCD
jgi:hypothetical protein